MPPALQCQFDAAITLFGPLDGRTSVGNWFPTHFTDCGGFRPVMTLSGAPAPLVTTYCGVTLVPAGNGNVFPVDGLYDVPRVVVTVPEDPAAVS
jgi:hypothetical protein